MPSIVPDTVHVAVAVIFNGDKDVLVALRPAHVHQGGLWEFPGGKIEQGESVEDALRREIREELDIDVIHASPLIRICHHYPDKSVLLDVWCVDSFTGEPQGAENQSIRWNSIDQLDPSEFPQANQAIIKALQLPDQMLITGEASDANDFLHKLEKALLKGVRLVQMRSKEINSHAYASLARSAQAMCKDYDARLLLNTNLDLFTQIDADGLHLNSQRLFTYNSRPVAVDKMLSASCHNEQEIQQANKLNADIILVSPVKPTSSHPGVPGLGWHRFMQLAAISNCPVYALGGMALEDMKDARYHGAQGIAAISCLWSYE